MPVGTAGIYVFKLFLDGSCSDFLSALSGSLGGSLALTAFLHGVGHGGDDQADGADGVIVAGDDIVNLVRVAVGVNDGDDGDVELAGLSDCVALLAGVNCLLYTSPSPRDI